MSANSRSFPLPKKFYLRTDVVKIASELLGKKLISVINGHRTAGIIIETEAYRAPEDKASHAYNNRRTRRTEVMFHEGGIAYIYLCYGIHHLFNVVTGPEDMAHAVLIRALQPAEGIDVMLQRRQKDIMTPQLTGGPGTLSQAMGFHRSITGHPLIKPDSRIWIEDAEVFAPSQIIAGPRVGVDYAGECAIWPWRFRLKS